MENPLFLKRQIYQFFDFQPLRLITTLQIKKSKFFQMYCVKFIHSSEGPSEPTQTSKMYLFTKIVNSK